jgi:hypothetical protein
MGAITDERLSAAKALRRRGMRREVSERRGMRVVPPTRRLGWSAAPVQLRASTSEPPNSRPTCGKLAAVR